MECEESDLRKLARRLQEIDLYTALKTLFFLIDDRLNCLELMGGRDGKSAYEVWKEHYNLPDATEQEFLDSLKGKDGKIGRDGKDGKDGVNGRDGKDGIIGKDGERGPIGPEGPRGEKGPKGDQGPKGEKGQDGIYGGDGPKGDKGDTGPRGPQGIEGPEGPEGPRGYQGERGPAGPQGERGDRGLQGATGQRGPQGDRGPKGEGGLVFTEFQLAQVNGLLPIETIAKKHTFIRRLASYCHYNLFRNQFNGGFKTHFYNIIFSDDTINLMAEFSGEANFGEFRHLIVKGFMSIKDPNSSTIYTHEFVAYGNNIAPTPQTFNTQIYRDNVSSKGMAEAYRLAAITTRPEFMNEGLVVRQMNWT